jgi:hypothetical protein
MERQIVKSDTATITIPEVELEIPPESQQVRVPQFFSASPSSFGRSFPMVEAQF